MAKSSCCDCQEVYEKNYSWMTRCIPCWKKSKGIAEAPKVKSFTNFHTAYQQQIAGLQTTINELTRALHNEQNKRQRYAATPALPKEMLGRLIRLAHPDRHGNSVASNEATAWLLSQRQK